MRETLSQALFDVAIFRITPAYAGNTRGDEEIDDVIRDHPRVCGKHKVLIPTLRFTAGSPPRMRETLQNFLNTWYFLGITPAYAGNTSV